MTFGDSCQSDDGVRFEKRSRHGVAMIRRHPLDGLPPDPRDAVVAVCHRLDAKNLLVATDGNVSVRIDDDVFVTRTGIGKGMVTRDDVIVVAPDGTPRTGNVTPSSELRMHLACYEERSSVRAVVHAHPPTAVAFTVAGQEDLLAAPIVPEVVVTLESIETIPYVTPGTEDLAECVRPIVRRRDAFMLERHGAVCVASTLLEALHRMEKVEHAAEIIHVAQQMGQVKRLSDQQVEELMAIRRRLGLDIDGIGSDTNVEWKAQPTNTTSGPNRNVTFDGFHPIRLDFDHDRPKSWDVGM